MASIAKRPDGRWRARYRDSAGNEHAKHFSRKYDAQAWLDEVTAAIVTGHWVNPRSAKTTLTSYFAEWSQRQPWATNTAKAMDLAVRSCTFNDIPFGNLRKSHVQKWVKSMAVNGLAASTQRTRLNNVRSVLRAAVEDRLLSADPTRGVPLPRLRRHEAAMRLPTSAQVAAVLAASTPDLEVMVSLAAFAGLRLGEVAGLQVGDIDFLRRTIRVRRQVQRAPGGEVEITLPKYGSERDVFAADELLALLSAHVKGVDGVDGWLFTGRGDQPAHQNTIGATWRSACATAEVTGIRYHDLRHYYASGLISSGCDVVTVQRALGHHSAVVTLSTYSHLWPTAEDKTRAAAGELVRAVAQASQQGAADSGRTGGAG